MRSFGRFLLLPLATLAVSGCALGAGPWQPGRDAHSTAGSTQTSMESSDAGRESDHQQAKSKRLPELGGGTTPMYAFDGAYYVGMKQGVGWARDTGASFGSTSFFMEGHAGFGHRLFGDRLVLGVNAFAAGYGTGDQTDQTKVTFVAFGGEAIAKVPLFGGLGLHVAGGPVYGRITRKDGPSMEAHADTGGWRATIGLDWVLMRLFGDDLVLMAELQEIRTGETTVGASSMIAEGRALAFELVLAAF
jgi:hypothetical protein